MRVRKVYLKVLTERDKRYKFHRFKPFELGYRDPITGKCRREYKATKEEALKRQQELFQEINGGTFVPKVRVSLQDAKKRYLAALAVEPETKAIYGRDIDQYGKICHDPDSEQWVAGTIRSYIQVRKSEVSAATVNKELRSLAAFFNWAKREAKIIKESPFDSIGIHARRLREPKKVQTVWTPEQFSAVLKACPDDRWRLLILMLVNGVGRLNSVATLTTDAVDKDYKFVRIYDKKVKGERIAPLAKSTRELLKKYIEANKPGEYLFRIGANPSRWSFSRKCWLNIIARAKVPHMSRHHLRKCLVKWLIQSGHPMSVSTAILGHSNEKTTRDWYFDHQAVDIRAEAVEKLPV